MDTRQPPDRVTDVKFGLSELGGGHRMASSLDSARPLVLTKAASVVKTDQREPKLTSSTRLGDQRKFEELLRVLEILNLHDV